MLTVKASGPNRLVIECRGYEAFGKARKSKRCRGRRTDLTAAAAGQRKGFRAKDLTYVCEACAGLRLSVTRVTRLVADWAKTSDSPIGDTLERLAPDGRIRSWSAHDEILRALTVQARTAHPIQGSVAARVSGRRASASRRTELVARGAAAQLDRAPRWLVAQWIRGLPNREIRACRRCGLLLSARLNVPANVNMHLRCYNAAKGELDARAWLSKRRALAVAGVPGPRAVRQLGEMPIAIAPGVRRRDPATLTRQMTWAVRHLIGGEPQAALGREADVTQQAVADGIRSVLALLPGPELADAQFRPWVVRLAAASS